METLGSTTSAATKPYLPTSTLTAQKLQASLSSFQSQLSELTTTLQKSTSGTAATQNVSAESLLNLLSGFSSYLSELTSGIGAGTTTASVPTAGDTETPTAVSALPSSTQAATSTGTLSSSLTTAYKDIANAPDNASYYVVPVEYGGVSSSVRLDNYAYHQWLTQIADGKDPNSAALALSGDGIGAGSPRFEAGFSALGYALGTGATGVNEANEIGLALGGSLESLNMAEFSNIGSPYGEAFAAVKQSAIKALLA